MASPFFSAILLSSLILFSASPSLAAKTQRFARSISPSSLGLLDRAQKLSHLHFFLHDVVGGENRTAGKFNGSSLAVLGRNAVEDAVREMPVVGGSGVFRFATGYAQAKTHAFGALEAVVEYNVYVFHY
ncbi:hypothetical protein Fmac_020325 [Flemingia macrophylla]|uniref:Dirigent protein n=1 Tax=Flemingia macrophylla TaxID=520843 RepID=A0ABD1LUC2_9FABA